MTTYLALLGLLAAAGIPYIVWTRLEARGHRRAAAVHADVAQMGADVAPPSLHPEIELDACIGSGACVRACPEDEVLGITDGRARLINPLACVGHSACMQACPVGAIKLVFGTARRGVELPMLTPDFETSRKGIYIVGELTGMGLIRNATLQGKQAGDTIARARRRGGTGDPDVVVVGAGPAGIAVALACMAHGLAVQVLEQGAFGGTITHYPRSKIVMTGTVELPGYGTVRRKTMRKEELLELWQDIRQRTQLDVREGVRVQAIEPDGERWVVVGEGLRVRTASVVLALGRRGAPRQLGIPGEELPKVVYRLLEPEPFAGKHVMVVGGGNAAADCAIALAEAKLCASVSLSYRREQLARLRGTVRARVEQLLATGEVRSLLGSELLRIGPDHVVLQRAGRTEEVPNDAVIVQIGGTSPNDLLRSIGIELVEKRGAA